ncbi:hypothetical protein L198_02152 [Cryptococcus wingfieldii CBS 7118]|uniref:HAT C-terminal dimerisation domain-containing protein n=1 Tax=Cryptococcus wingfieldii CBS 7118 TaxID=1295528 RepID=A0A1E3JR01_9TREE|nr:hypothetical protein L198_02152 [Cryptococcus wingfieldii CBS 7118]ODO03308.1 hypothetical protein L198_02152 [Cryptococcus wingfieldii CBS 7118]
MLHGPIRQGLTSIEKYYRKAIEAKTPVIAVYLNPLMKHWWFELNLGTRLAAEANDIFREIYDEFAIAKRSSNTSDNHVSCPQAPLTEMQRKIKDLQKASLAFRGSGNLSDEFDRYISFFEEDDSLSLLAATPAKIEPDFVLQWWNRNEFAFPIISGIARDFLAIPASSVPCERLFSYAKLADTEKRRCMSEGTFSDLQTLGAAYREERRVQDEGKRKGSTFIDDRDVQKKSKNKESI